MKKNKACASCGNDVYSLDEKFCGYCGAPVNAPLKRKKRAGKGAAISLVSLCVAAVVLGAMAVGTFVNGQAPRVQGTALAGGAGNNLPSSTVAPQTDISAQVDHWAVFPTLSLLQMSSCEEGGYVYWACGALINRMPKEGGETEVLINVAEFYQHAVDAGDIDDINEYQSGAIAVLDGWLYFTCRINPINVYAYYRVPVEGGSPEHLFVGKFSFMQVYEGTIYMLYVNAQEYHLATYMPEVDDVPQYTVIDTRQYYPPAYCVLFSIRDGKVYYTYNGRSADENDIRVYDLASGGVDELFVIEENEDSKHFDIFFAGGAMYYAEDIARGAGVSAVKKQDLDTGEFEIIVGGQRSRGSRWVLAVPLAGSLIYSVAHDPDADTYTYATANFGDEYNVQQIFELPSKITQSYGPWAFFDEGVLDGRTGEISTLNVDAAMYSLDDLMPVYEQAREIYHIYVNPEIDTGIFLS